MTSDTQLAYEDRNCADGVKSSSPVAFIEQWRLNNIMTIKFCKDCKYYEDDDIPMCIKHERESQPDIVTGTTWKVGAMVCRFERSFSAIENLFELNEHCGKSGRFWEPK